jgi:hypothetical protein
MCICVCMCVCVLYGVYVCLYMCVSMYPQAGTTHSSGVCAYLRNFQVPYAESPSHLCFLVTFYI